MQGKIIKGIAGFYYVHVAESGIYECKAKGAFRNQKVKPLVGDNIRLDVLDEEEKKVTSKRRVSGPLHQRSPGRGPY